MLDDYFDEAKPLLQAADSDWAHEVLVVHAAALVDQHEATEALHRICEPLAHTPGVFTVGTSAVRDSPLVGGLAEDLQDAAVTALLVKADDAWVGRSDRSSYLRAATNLVDNLSESRREHHFDAALARATSPSESLGDQAKDSISHPLGAVRIGPALRNLGAQHWGPKGTRSLLQEVPDEGGDRSGLFEQKHVGPSRDHGQFSVGQGSVEGDLALQCDDVIVGGHDQHPARVGDQASAGAASWAASSAALRMRMGKCSRPSGDNWAYRSTTTAGYPASAESCAGARGRTIQSGARSAELMIVSEDTRSGRRTATRAATTPSAL